ncbi:hypothetical protein [Humisphaera borealis]|uniref:Uncharacterized protein n=1 Tax=Humisphaera borealis TaxID=2807512 RepID=A0A7M2X0C8_9BACT|nr:hypothetical protein [Humisphaera borealis]QOV91216.1 hypothetical protein IPV69_07620 [Humisphaera borealis]
MPAPVCSPIAWQKVTLQLTEIVIEDRKLSDQINVYGDMIRTKRRLAVVLLLTPVLSSAAQACRCLPPPPPKEAMEKSAAVFFGRALSVENKGGNISIKFAVERTWKGVDSKEIVVVTPTNSCGRTFEKGKQYIIYATADKGGALGTNLCDRTKSSEQAADDLKALGDGKEPIEKK